MSFPSQESLQKYAELVVHVGLNLREGQRLHINSLTTRGVLLHNAPLVREVAKAAYKAGARYVDVLWSDEELLKIRVQMAPRDSFNEFSDWQVKAVMDLFEQDGANLTIRSNNPNLMDGEDPEILGQVQKVYLKSYEQYGNLIGQNKINWLVIAAAGPAWAARVFPDLEPAEAEKKLWEAIFSITRADQPDPVSAWEKHVRELHTRSEYLNAKQYTALHYTAPGTDLTVGLPPGHFWNSAGSRTQTGIFYIANMPTEEIFTLPHKDQINGHVSASMPLSYGGVLLEGFPGKPVFFQHDTLHLAITADFDRALEKAKNTAGWFGRTGGFRKLFEEFEVLLTTRIVDVRKFGFALRIQDQLFRIDVRNTTVQVTEFFQFLGAELRLGGPAPADDNYLFDPAAG